jgi:hypothetical protein
MNTKTGIGMTDRNKHGTATHLFFIKKNFYYEKKCGE